MEFASHDLFMECDDETPLKIKGVVTHINPSSNDKVSYFVQNGSEGFYIYSQDTTQMPVELGKSYEIGGFKKTYRGLSDNSITWTEGTNAIWNFVKNPMLILRLEIFFLPTPQFCSLLHQK